MTLNTIPTRLVAKIAAAVIIGYGIVHFIILPLSQNLSGRINQIVDFYSASNKIQLQKIQRQQNALQQLEKRLADVTASPGKSASSYDFLQEFLKKRNIQAVKITGGEEEPLGGMVAHDYTIEYEGTYLSLGSLVNDLENGPFVCEIKSLNAVPKSVFGSLLAIELKVSFYRSAK
jgi:hypothetical protein